MRHLKMMATEGPAKLDRRNGVSIPEHGEAFNLGSKFPTLNFSAGLKWPVEYRLD